MRRATITIDNDLETGLETYLRQQDATPSLTSVVQVALREFLARRGLATDAPKFRITPAKKGSGVRDVSIRHDRYLAGK